MIALADNSNFIAVCAFVLVGLLVSVTLTILSPPSAEAVEILARFL
jgi:hypothetical protein